METFRKHWKQGEEKEEERDRQRGGMWGGGGGKDAKSDMLSIKGWKESKKGEL